VLAQAIQGWPTFITGGQYGSLVQMSRDDRGSSASYGFQVWSPLSDQQFVTRSYAGSEGPDAKAFLFGHVLEYSAGAFIHAWDDSGWLAVTTYDSTFTKSVRNVDHTLRTGSDGTFLVGDFEGNTLRRHLLAQFYDLGSNAVGFSVYRFKDFTAGFELCSKNTTPVDGAALQYLCLQRDKQQTVPGPHNPTLVIRAARLQDGSLGLTVFRYAGDGAGFVTKTVNPGILVAADNIGFVAADVDADGNDELLQIYPDAGRFVASVYKLDADGGLASMSSADLGPIIFGAPMPPMAVPFPAAKDSHGRETVPAFDRLLLPFSTANVSARVWPRLPWGFEP